MTAKTKAEYRSALQQKRRAVSAAAHQIEAEQLCGHLVDAVGDAATVCAYLPVGTEPGSEALVGRLRALCEVVLLPVTQTGSEGEHLPLGWGEYVPGTLISARFGLLEPPQPWLEPPAIAQAGVVLVPALAVDRAGVRLGRGGGFYDRSLPLCAPGTRLVAVVRDDELVESLPAEPHDVRMTHALTPGGGLIAFGGMTGRG